MLIYHLQTIVLKIRELHQEKRLVNILNHSPKHCKDQDNCVRVLADDSTESIINTMQFYTISYQAASGLLLSQIRGALPTSRLSLHSMWLMGFCQIARSPFSVTFLQQRRFAKSSISSCSCFKSFSALCHPMWWIFQLIGGPERIQYPPGLNTLSTSIKYSPSVD